MPFNCTTLFKLFCLCIATLVFGCKKQDLSKIDTYTSQGSINAVIEIPAGTTKKIEYNKETLEFNVDQIDGKDRIIKFLPYIGNYGFIPSTLSDTAKGGDGDPLDVIVISETKSTGTILSVIPIAVIRIVDEGEEDDKIIAVPSNSSDRILDIESFKEWKDCYPASIEMLLTWYNNYDSSGQNVILGIEDETVAKSIIKKWQL